MTPTGLGETSPVRETRDLDTILRCLGRKHPHIVGQPPLRRAFERHRIGHALRSEADAMDLAMVYLPEPDGSARAGALAMIPKEGSKDRFGSYGPSPMFVGFLFGFGNSASLSTVFGAIAEAGRRAGRNAIFGPVEATINHSIGLLDGSSTFPPSFLMPRNPAVWSEWLEDAGLSVAQRLFTYELPFDRGAFHDFRAERKVDDRILVTALRTPFSETERGALVEVFNSGWRGNWGFVPLDDADVRDLEREFRPLLWDGLAYIASVDGVPAGIAVAVPDLNEVSVSGTLIGELSGAARLLLRRRPRAVKLLILGLAKPFHRSILGLNVIEVLIREIVQVAEKRYGASHLQMGWTLESNRAVNHLIHRWAPNSARTVHTVWTLEL